MWAHIDIQPWLVLTPENGVLVTVPVLDLRGSRHDALTIETIDEWLDAWTGPEGASEPELATEDSK